MSAPLFRAELSLLLSSIGSEAEGLGFVLRSLSGVLGAISARPAVLETTFETASGLARLVDLMPVVEDVGTLQPLREMLAHHRGHRR